METQRAEDAFSGLIEAFRDFATSLEDLAREVAYMTINAAPRSLEAPSPLRKDAQSPEKVDRQNSAVRRRPTRKEVRPVADITLKTKVDTQELDEAIEKAARLVELLREAQRLANSLAGRPEMDAKKLLNVLTNAYIDEMDKRWEAFEKTRF